ncbi:hypothetical protein [Rhizobium sp. CIAT894]|uniref:hypothetical protein n=1 Tax=Rhizobium sp. CIAT894 TaxID=2020312 RepID=UPI0001909FA7|nr:hypothetical protein [Rhizobium sp. CIAT894]
MRAADTGRLKVLALAMKVRMRRLQPARAWCQMTIETSVDGLRSERQNRQHHPEHPDCPNII